MSAADTVKIFITTQAKPETNLFDWMRHLEELRCLIAEATSTSEWNQLAAYESTPDFGSGQACYVTNLSNASLNILKEAVAEHIWLPCPVKIYVAAEVVQ